MQDLYFVVNMSYSSAKTAQKVTPVNGSIFTTNITKIKTLAIDVVKRGHYVNSVLSLHYANEAGGVWMA